MFQKLRTSSYTYSYIYSYINMNFVATYIAIPYVCTHIVFCELHLGKPFDQLGPRQQRRRKVQIKYALNNMPFKEMGLALRTVQLESASHRKVEIKLHPQTSDKTEISEDHTPDIVYLMLKHGVSFQFYHELCERFGDLPRAYKVYKMIS